MPFIWIFLQEPKDCINMCKILKEISGLSADELLKKYNISSTPPIDLKNLLERIGVSSYPYDFSKVEKLAGYEPNTIIGAAISTEDNLDIMYAKNMSENRVRFTIAHELAHCCLHSDNLKIKHIELRLDKDASPREMNANIFAEELLIPQKSLNAIYDKLYVPTLSVLSEIFKVSTNVMRARLGHLKMSFVDDSYAD